MQESLQFADERNVERMKRAAQPFETLEQVNARRQAAGQPPIVPYVPQAPKPRRKSTRSSR